MILSEKFNDIERYWPNQIYMMKDGTLIFITEVEPISKLRASNKERMITGKKVKPRSQDKTLADTLVMFTEPASGIVYQIDITQSVKMSIKDMRNNEAAYIGTITSSLLEKINRQLSDFHNNNW